MLTPQFAAIAPRFYSMAAFCVLYANIHHYAGRIFFLIESSDVLTTAGWDQTACHHRHPFCAYFLKRFELSILNILNVNQAAHCLTLLPLEFVTTWTPSSTLILEPNIDLQ